MNSMIGAKFYGSFNLVISDPLPIMETSDGRIL